MSNWIYKGKILMTPPEGMYGFIYRIVCTDKTSDKFGWVYIGKKCFEFSIKKKISKKVKKATKTRRVTERVAKNSGWLSYFGSSLTLKADIKLLGEDAFKREIICFARNKSELSYLELVHQIENEVLLKPSWNNWISAKIYKAHLTKLN